MKFVVICHDKPGTAELRAATRTAHRAYIDTVQHRLLHAGAMSNADGQTCGYILVVEAADRADAERLAAGDPYAKAGVFGSTTVMGYRLAVVDGVRME